MEIDKTPGSLIVVGSHRRSGTHWVIDAIRHNFPDVEYQFHNLDRISPGHQDHIPLDRFVRMLSRSSKCSILKSHMKSRLTFFDGEEKHFVEEVLRKNRVIYVYRDGRDVLVSLYHYIRAFRNDLPSFADFIRMRNDFDPSSDSANRVEFWKSHVSGWLARPDLKIATISYEALWSDYKGAVRALGDFLNLPLRPNGIERIDLKKYGLIRRLLRRIYPRSARTSAILPHKGMVGEWKGHFTEEDLSLFDSVAGDLMAELGYDHNARDPHPESHAVDARHETKGTVQLLNRGLD